jgi:hypothetical protein
MHITIPKWEKYNPRKDVKKGTWLRLEHDLFENPELEDFTLPEVCSWLYLLCQASKKSDGMIEVKLAHVERIGRIKRKDFLSAVEKLKEIGWIVVDDTVAARLRNVDVTSAAATNERTDERDETNVRNGRTEDSVAVGTTAPPAPILRNLEGDYSQTALELLAGVPLRLQESWLSAYPDAAWIRQELNKAAAWILANPKKKPKKFPAFMSNWLARGWEDFRKTLPSNKPTAAEPEWKRQVRAREEAARKERHAAS